VRPLLPSIRRPARVFAAGIALFALLALATTALFQFLPGGFVRLIVALGLSSTGFTLTALAICAAAMLPSTLVLGALFPVAAGLAGGSDGESGEAVGAIYFSNTFGGALDTRRGTAGTGCRSCRRHPGGRFAVGAARGGRTAQ